jgi:hypothetical protein
MKNSSTHKGKGKAWGSLTSQPKAETTAGPTAGDKASGSPASKFIGATKGNKDLPPNRTSGVSTGHGGGPHKAGGK